MASGYDLTLSGLLRKRADLAGQVQAKQCELASLISAMQHIDGANQGSKVIAIALILA
jgi:hypothetical protein